jgi:hypothetical protein
VKRPPVHTVQEDGWCPESVWALWRKEKSCTPGNRIRAVKPVARRFTNSDVITNKSPNYVSSGFFNTIKMFRKIPNSYLFFLRVIFSNPAEARAPVHMHTRNRLDAVIILRHENKYRNCFSKRSQMKQVKLVPVLN